MRVGSDWAITAPAEAEGKFIRQSGGRGQYGHVKLFVEPAETEAGFVFENRIVGGVIPKEFIPAVQAGVREVMESGILAGYAMRDIRVELRDGSHHEVDSSEIAFKIAGSMAFKDACQKAGLLLLEPVMKVEITVPEGYSGEVISDLNTRQGKIEQIMSRGLVQVITASVPLSKMFGYSTALRSATQGRATYSMEFDKYVEAPKVVSDAVISSKTGM